MISAFGGYAAGVATRTAWQLWQLFGFVFAVAYLMQLAGSMIRRGGLGLMGRAYWYLVAPGVAMHETGHAAGCIVTWTKILKFVPFKPSGTTLGYVSHETRRGWIGAVTELVIATGPIWFGSLVIMVLTKLMAGSLPVGEWSGYFAAGRIPGVIGYVEGVFFAAFDCLGGAALAGDATGAFFWIWLYLVFCIASEIGLSNTDIAGMRGGILVIGLAFLAVNAVPSVGGAVTAGVFRLMPSLFRVHVLMVSVLMINIAIALVVWPIGRLRS